MRIGMPLLFQELAIPRIPYKVPCVLSVKDLRFPGRAVRYTQTGLPLSDLEFCITYPECARDLGIDKLVLRSQA